MRMCFVTLSENLTNNHYSFLKLGGSCLEFSSNIDSVLFIILLTKAFYIHYCFILIGSKQFEIYSQGFCSSLLHEKLFVNLPHGCFLTGYSGVAPQVEMLLLVN